jgi:hypothetical protein
MSNGDSKAATGEEKTSDRPTDFPLKTNDSAATTVAGLPAEPVENLLYNLRLGIANPASSAWRNLI